MPPPEARAAVDWQRDLVWLWLGIWLGSMVLFGLLTQVAFRLIPDPDSVGRMVGALLHPMLSFGVASGLGLALLAASLRRGRVSIVVPLVLASASAINRFGVSPAVAEIPLTDPGLAPELAARFAALHRLSVWLFVATGIGIGVLVAVHLLAEFRQLGEAGDRDAPPA